MNEITAKKVAEYLKNGGRIGNGKVFSISFSFVNGMFRKEGEDMREKEKFTSTYSYEGFLVEIQTYKLSEFVGLSEKIKHIKIEDNTPLKSFFQKLFKLKS